MSPDAVFSAVTSYAGDWINLFTAWVRTLPVSFAFSAGMVATVNPCGFIMLPSFALFYFGTEDGTRRTALDRVARAVVMGILVSAVFVATFAVIGLVVLAVGRQIIGWTYWAGLGTGLMLAALGAYQLVTRRTVFANLTSGVRITRSRSVQGVIVFGFAYAIVSLGCTLPIFMLVMGGVFTGDADYVTSGWRFIEYGAGMGVVLTLVAVGVAVARQPVVSLAGAAIPWIQGFVNVALVFAGAYVTWYWWKALT